jgi:hypothetical protein
MFKVAVVLGPAVVAKTVVYQKLPVVTLFDGKLDRFPTSPHQSISPAFKLRAPIIKPSEMTSAKLHPELQFRRFSLGHYSNISREGPDAYKRKTQVFFAI